VGAPAQETWTFKVITEGNINLKFESMRGWKTTSAETVAYDITTTK